MIGNQVIADRFEIEQLVGSGQMPVGLAIILSIFRTRQTLNVDELDLMKS